MHAALGKWLSLGPPSDPASLIPLSGEEAGEVITQSAIRTPKISARNWGILLFQVMSHSQIAEEKGLFTIDDVVDGVSAKMVVKASERIRG